MLILHWEVLYMFHLSQSNKGTKAWFGIQEAYLGKMFQHHKLYY